MNGNLDDGVLRGVVPAAQFDPPLNATVGTPLGGFYFQGTIDEVRVYNRALSQAEIQADMNQAVTPSTGDSTPPTVSISSPADGAQVTDTATIGASAADNVGVAGVQFFVDGVAAGPEDRTAPYAVPWDTHLGANGTHTLTARARDLTGNATLSPAGRSLSREHRCLSGRDPRHTTLDSRPASPFFPTAGCSSGRWAARSSSCRHRTRSLIRRPC